MSIQSRLVRTHAVLFVMVVVGFAWPSARAQVHFRFADGFDLSVLSGSPTRAISAPSGPLGGITLFGTFYPVAGSVSNSFSSAHWDGQSFSRFPAAPTAAYNFALAKSPVFVETGPNPGYYSIHPVNGQFRFWTGTAWQNLGVAEPSSFTAELFVIREAGIDQIYLALSPTVSGGFNAFPLIKKWNGTSFQSLPTTGWPTGGLPIRDLELFDGGLGPQLVAAILGKDPVLFDGSTWQSLGSLPNGVVIEDLEVVSMPNGPELWAVGGAQPTAPSNVFKWNGAGWTALPTPNISGTVRQIKSIPGANGSEVFIEGVFPGAGGTSVAATFRRTGGTWSPVPGRRAGGSDELVKHVVAGQTVLDFVHTAGIGVVIARWTDPTLVYQTGHGISGIVLSLLRYDDGNGDKLWIGGTLNGSGATDFRGLATFDGERLEPAGGALIGYASYPTSNAITFGGTVYALSAFGTGSGRRLYAGGNFNTVSTIASPVDGIARWDGTTWSAVGTGIRRGGAPGTVYAMAEFDAGTGPEFYVAGDFDSAGGVPVQNIARWNGTAWQSVGFGTNGPIYALAAYGGQLFIGGSFTTAAATPTIGLARWNGTSVSVTANGLDAFGKYINAFHVSGDGAGEKLYAGGFFNSIEGFATSSIAAFDGASWSALGAGIADPQAPIVGAMTSFDEGDGAALYVGGLFGSVGGVPANRIAKWKNGTWSALDGGVDHLLPFGGGATSGAVWALHVAADPRGGEALFLGGDFSRADQRPSQAFAMWGANPTGDATAVLGEAAESAVGASVGAPFDVVRVQGRVGNGHRVNVAIGEAIAFDVLQPPTVPWVTGFTMFGFVGVPSALDVYTSIIGLGDFAFTPCPADPSDARLFVLADAFGLPGCAPLVGAGGTPWTLALPAGIPFPADFTIQGIIGDNSAQFGIAKTNAVLISVR